MLVILDTNVIGMSGRKSSVHNQDAIIHCLKAVIQKTSDSKYETD